MTSNNWDGVQSIFLAVADMPLVERCALLDSARGANRELRAEVESLLASDSEQSEAISVAVAKEVILLCAAGPGLATYRETHLGGVRIGQQQLMRELS